MAEEISVRGIEVRARSPWAVALLPFVTLGVYHLVWWYRVNRELRDYGNARGVDLGRSPTRSLLALFPGGLLVVPALISYFNGVKRVQAATGLIGREPPSGWIALALYVLLAPALWAYMQDSLNQVWAEEA